MYFSTTYFLRIECGQDAVAEHHQKNFNAVRALTREQRGGEKKFHHTRYVVKRKTESVRRSKRGVCV